MCCVCRLFTEAITHKKACTGHCWYEAAAVLQTLFRPDTERLQEHFWYSLNQRRSWKEIFQKKEETVAQKIQVQALRMVCRYEKPLTHEAESIQNVPMHTGLQLLRKARLAPVWLEEVYSATIQLLMHEHKHVNAMWT